MAFHQHFWFMRARTDLFLLGVAQNVKSLTLDVYSLLAQWNNSQTEALSSYHLASTIFELNIRILFHNFIWIILHIAALLLLFSSTPFITLSSNIDKHLIFGPLKGQIPFFTVLNLSFWLFQYLIILGCTENSTTSGLHFIVLSKFNNIQLMKLYNFSSSFLFSLTYTHTK